MKEAGEAATFDVGVHGIEFDNYDGIKKEHRLFQELSGLKNFGMRMHYLRNSGNTVELLNQVGYIFDSTLYKLENPFKTAGYGAAGISADVLLNKARILKGLGLFETPAAALTAILTGNLSPEAATAISGFSGIGCSMS